MESDQISALVLAAGHSSRMGRPKMTLSWGETTVIGKVVTTLAETSVNGIYIITGGNHKELVSALCDHMVHYVNNKNHAAGEMLSSVKVGIKSLPPNTRAALIVLGDQPQIERDVVEKLLDEYRSTKGKIIVPSYQQHRGHPWLVDRVYWDAIQRLAPTGTLRNFLQEKQDEIDYVNVETASILQDLDTPGDYLAYRQGG